ncbi:GNAT family N-acetyltransferase [Brevibacillus dissolubilis]|uniref:GNAT family N-acetyltransferase n=1 Tax=Brevibacillus dissolubilis TaxID=1844116 RepID=UPI0011164BF4|nr:GNAT family N-acetyltransferase [Brevibacillus dissolubilis]
MEGHINEHHYQVRAVDASQIDQLIPLMQGYFDFYKREQPEAAIRQHVHTLLDHPREGIQFMIWKGETAVGFVTLYFTYSTLSLKRTAVLNDLFLLSSERGGGAAEILFQHALTYIREQGMAGMEWVTAKDNLRAQRFYDKMEAKTGDWLLYSI